MKNLLFVLILFSVNAFGQIDITGQTLNILPEKKKERKTFWKDFAGYAILATAGAANGMRDAYVAEPSIFQSRFGASKNGWFGSESWRNKYKNGNPDDGEKFLGSTSILAPTTDFYHFSGAMRTTGLIAGTTLITIGEKKPFWHYVLKVTAGGVVYGLSSHVSYNMLRFKKVF